MENLHEFHIDADQIPGFNFQEMIAPAGNHRPVFLRLRKKVIDGEVKWVRYRAKNHSIDLIIHI